VSERTVPIQRTGDTTPWLLDVVGIGALNLDYVVQVMGGTSMADRPTATDYLGELARITGEPTEAGTEQTVDESAIFAAIEMADSWPIETSMGGSAHNAIRTLAQTGLGLRLGFVGLAGRVPVVGISSLTEFDALGIDRSHVAFDAEHLSGVCVSFVADGDRTMLTHSGANSQCGNYFVDRGPMIVDYLSQSRIIHVTSFLDDFTPGKLLGVLTAVKDQSPHTMISFDPGHVWSARRTPAINGILALTDYLLVNHKEFSVLGGWTPGTTDESVAKSLLSQLGSEDGIVVLKKAEGITFFQADDEAVQVDTYPQPPLASSEIQDSTGAGDVFAAGLLAALASDHLKIELGALLGMRLTRHKLKRVGSQGSISYPDITRNFFESLDDQQRAGSFPQGVFVGHGGSPEWITVRDFIQKRMGLPCYSFESDAWDSLEVTAALTSYLDRCGFAVGVLTAEDLTMDGRRVARQNVIHEVGLFQGRYGFDRVALLVEEGCDFVPALTEVSIIPFRANFVEQALYELAEALRQKLSFESPPY
jgi:sugar/nucleoside kinase (ribokinase family)